MFRLFLYLIFVFSATLAFAQEVSVPVEKRSGLLVAIYNRNLALVKDTRKVDLKKGTNKIAFSNVSASIRPETVLVRGEGFTVLEQNFNFDLLNYGNLLEKSVGKKVKLVKVNPGNGDVVEEEGELLSNSGGAVLKIGDRIEANYPGRIIFLDIPDSLRSRPTLVLELLAAADISQDVGLSYLTGGLSWRTDYVAEMNAKEDRININGLVTLTNTSGTDFEGATMQLVAGDVNLVPQNFEKMAMDSALPMMAMTKNMAYGRAEVATESFADFHLYTVPRKVDIANRQTKQIALLSGAAKVDKKYVFENLFNMYNGEGAFSFERMNPFSRVEFHNDEKQGLGKPLPAGVFRIYKADSRGNILFAGEDRIPHTAKGERVEINLGTAFDVTADGKRMEYTKLGTKSYEASYELKIRNARNEDIVVDFYQDFYGTFQILSESLKHIKENSNRLLWKIPVAKSSETVFNFKVRITQN